MSAIWSMRRKKVVLLLAMLAAGALATAAYAAWFGSGFGPGKAKGGKVRLAIAASADLPEGANALFPGGVGDVAVDVTNLNPVTVDALSFEIPAGSLARVTSSDETNCPSSNVTVASRGVTSLPAPVSIVRGATRVVILPDALAMSSSAPSGCQDVSFTVEPVTVNAST